jgi:hypothetical protein
MKEISCNIIKDLLPLYTDNAVSAESRQMVEEHLKECESCSEELKQLKESIAVPMDNNTKPLKKIKKKIIWKQVFAGALSAVLVLVILFTGAYFITDYKYPVKYKDISDKISVIEEKNGDVQIKLNGRKISGTVGRYIDIRKDPDKKIIEQALYLYAVDTVWNKYFSDDDSYLFGNYGGEQRSTNDNITYEVVVTEVYYQQFVFKDYEKTKGEAVLLWKKK